MESPTRTPFSEVQRASSTVAVRRVLPSEQ
jgi:hypothetical protein